MRTYSRWTTIKALFMVLTMVWLYSYQSYHRLVEHGNEHQGHCHHHHASTPESPAPTSEHEEDCEICKVVSCAFTATPSFYYQVFLTTSRVVHQDNYQQPYCVFFSLTPPHRGPPTA